MIRDGLKVLLNGQADMQVVGEASDGVTACRQAQELMPDIVIMDVTMPKMNGAKATEVIKREHPQIKVVALTAHEDKGYIKQLLHAGVSGYVLKLSAAEELINAIRMVAAGGVYLDAELAGKVVDSYIRKEAATGRAQGRDLTEREEEVLRLVAKGYINKEIAAQLGISVKTIESHKTNLMEKLDLKSRAEIVRYALSKGWLQDS
jgi:DNA-binding NarL/FixJ family response regulator